MENVVVGRIVHIVDLQEASKAKCRPFIITDVHSLTVVSGQVLLSPFDEIEDSKGTSIWVTSIAEEPAEVDGALREGAHDGGLWHDPRLC